MEFRKGLQLELQEKNIRVEAEEEELVLSPTEVVRLNHEIGLMIDEDRIMLESSPGKAARFACSR